MAIIKNRGKQLSLFDNHTGLVCVTDALFSAIVAILNNRLKKCLKKVNSKLLENTYIYLGVRDKYPDLLIIHRKGEMELSLFINSIHVNRDVALVNVSIIFPLRGTIDALDTFFSQLKLVLELPDEVQAVQGALSYNLSLQGEELPVRKKHFTRDYFALASEFRQLSNNAISGVAS